MSNHSAAFSALLLIAIAPASHAQTAASPPETCAGIAPDIERLACYDAYYRRGPEDTRAADEAARAAAIALAAQQWADENAAAVTSQEESSTSTLQRRIGRWFSHGPVSDNSEIVPLDDPISTLANAGRGSLLDSRWELAKDSKFGVFNLRAYKPIYALPMFWASRTNPLPHSPNPNNTITEATHTQPVEGKFQLSFKT